MKLKSLFAVLLIGCAITPPPPTRIDLPTSAPTCPKTYPHKISMLEYCTIKGQQQIDYVSYFNAQPECPQERQFILHAFETGVMANDYAIDAYCQGIEDAHDYKTDEAQYAALHQVCDSDNKTQAYKKEAAQQLASLYDQNTCILKERTEAAFNIGYYCPTHSPEYVKWRDQYIKGFTEACIGHDPSYQSECNKWGKYLYLRITH